MNLGTLRKTTDSNCDKIRAVKRKWQFWNNFYLPLVLKFPDTLNICSDEIGKDINVCDFLIMYNEICQSLEELHKSVICFPNDKYMKLQNYIWVKQPFKV